MAVDTPVLERRTTELTRVNTPFATATRSVYESDEEHNARIKENYARLINPDSVKEDVVSSNVAAPVAQQPVQVAQQFVQTESQVRTEPYLVRNARADAAIFRADNPVNRRFVEDVAVVSEEENEDLRPTAATIQYRTVDCVEEESEEQSERFRLTKKQKTTLIALAAVIVSLIVLIIINATVIANLNSDIAYINTGIANVNFEIQTSVSNIIDKISKAQTGIDTLRGAAAGINSTVSEVMNGLIG